MQVTIIGMGRIGRVFAQHARAEGHEVVPVTRAAGAPARDGPIVVSVGESDLAAAVANLSPAQGPRCVFVQNGLIAPAVAHLGATGRGLLHFNAGAEGNVRVLEPSVFGGEAGAIAAPWLDRHGIPARHQPDPERLRIEEVRKLLWSTVLSVLAAARGVPVGRLFQDHGEAVEALARECVRIAGAVLGTKPDPAELIASLRRMAAALPDYPGSRRGQDYRNALLVRLARERGIPAPENERVLRDLGVRV